MTFQPSIFESYPSTRVTTTPTIFSNPRAEIESFPVSVEVMTANPRQAIIDATIARQTTAFRDAYEAFVLEFAENATMPFSAPEATAAYKRSGLPKPPKSYQCTGAIFQRLGREGKLRSCGRNVRSDKYGNFLETWVKG